jgi:glyoxylase I family protein
MAAITGVAHFGLTVRDLERSAAWYTDLLGLVELFGGQEEDVSFTVFLHPDSGMVVGLREYAQGSGDQFSEHRTGLDHIAFGVADRAALEGLQAELRDRAITHSPIADTPYGHVLTFRDPDNIQLEFFALRSD